MAFMPKGDALLTGGNDEKTGELSLWDLRSILKRRGAGDATTMAASENGCQGTLELIWRRVAISKVGVANGLAAIKLIL